MKPRAIIGDLLIYGDWDDVRDYEFVVVDHESGSHVDVLLMSGLDYGGGISSAYVDVPRNGLFNIIDRLRDPTDLYGLKEEVREYCILKGTEVKV